MTTRGRRRRTCGACRGRSPGAARPPCRPIAGPGAPCTDRCARPSCYVRACCASGRRAWCALFCLRERRCSCCVFFGSCCLMLGNPCPWARGRRRPDLAFRREVCGSRSILLVLVYVPFLLEDQGSSAVCFIERIEGWREDIGDIFGGMCNLGLSGFLFFSFVSFF